MFLLPNLDSVASRFPADVSDAREFLMDRGIPVTTREAMSHLSGRLAADASFRRDLTSLLQHVIRGSENAVDYMDLLAIVVVAAAGEARLAQEESAREVLRFLTHVQPSEQGGVPLRELISARDVSPLRTAVAVPVVVPAVVAEPVMETMTDAAMKTRPVEARTPMAWEQDPSTETLDVPWWRKQGTWAGVVAVLIVGAAAFWLMHRGRTSESVVGVLPASSEVASQPNASEDGSEADSAKPENSGVPAARTTSRRSVTRRAMEGRAVVSHAGVSARDHEEPTAAPGFVAPIVRSAAPISRGASSGVTVRKDAPMVAAAPAASMAAASGRRQLPKVIVLNPGASRRSAASMADMGPATHGVVHPGVAGIMAGNLISGPAPAYPQAALQARVQGEVNVRAVVDREGKVIDARVVSGPELLRGAALDAVQQWRYLPYTQGGKPLEVATTAILDFEIP